VRHERDREASSRWYDRAVPPETLLFLYAAGVAAGIVSVLVSLASLISYPALLAVGLSPVSANVTNTVALVFTGVGAGLGSQRELRGLGSVLLRLAVAAAVGGFAGAALLLVLPERVFELVAPVLIAGASLLVLAGPRIAANPVMRPQGLRPVTVAAYTATAVYTGYFGAAGGVLALAALSTIIDRPFHDVNAAKNTLSAVANATAAVVFALLGPVQWLYVVPLALGLFTGGLVGPAIARRVPAPVLRVVVALCGLGVAAALGWATWA
jgi:uncharacterized membrane protein YfcA